tara:strand:+ start:415 stop:2214 length:1800 start_codon:yes stop_codon:yes gene_type:complete
MKIQKERLLFTILFLFSVFIGSSTWDLIEISYQDPGIIGQYSKNKYNGFNDILRYSLFLIIPTVTILFYKYFVNKNFLSDLSFFFKGGTSDRFIFGKNINLNLFYLFVIFILFLGFFSTNFPTFAIDSYHEGQRTSSAYKNFIDNTLWSGSYITVGIFYETLSSSIFWKFFDHISIGLARFADVVYIFIFKILFVSLIYYLTKLTKLNNPKQITFFLINSALIIFLVDYNIGNVDVISYREIPIILLIFFFIQVVSNNKVLFSLFCISALSVISMLWGVDRGIVYNILILIILFYLILTKKNKEFFYFIFFIVLNWISLYFVLGKEFNYFIHNTFLIYKEMNYVHGIIHPTPFTDQANSSRATKTLLLILICIMISINLIFKKKYPKEFVKLIIFFTIISVGSYLYALGRSDGPHIKNSFGFPLITFVIFISYLLLKKIKNFSGVKLLSLNVIILFFMTLSSNINLSNLFSFKKRHQSYINLEDHKFLSNTEKKLVQFLEPKVKNLECIQLFSNDAILYYLLRKKSCTKFYFVWSASSIFNQRRFINDLKKVDLIIYGGQKNLWDYPLSEKLFLVDNYINKNFYILESFESWNVLIRQK